MIALFIVNAGFNGRNYTLNHNADYDEWLGGWFWRVVVGWGGEGRSVPRHLSQLPRGSSQTKGPSN